MRETSEIGREFTLANKKSEASKADQDCRRLMFDILLDIRMLIQKQNILLEEDNEI